MFGEFAEFVGAPEMNGHRPSRTGTISLRPTPEVAEDVRSAGRPAFLIHGVWPEDAYGVVGADDKAGKTFSILDLAVSVATGTPWLEHFPCQAGRVIAYLGEGGQRPMIRRIGAIVRSRGGELSDLTDLHLGFAVPRLLRPRDMQDTADQVQELKPRLTIIDPLYLAAAGGKGADLYAMGDMLGGVQEICQEAGSALILTAHWNKTGEGAGPKRFTGVGPGAWGRVLGSAAVEHRRKEPDGTSDVLLRWEFMGSEIPETSFRMRRRVRAEDPNDLDSPLHYAVEVIDIEADEGDDLSPSRRRVLTVLQAAATGLTVKLIGDGLADDGDGPPLKRRTIDDALRDLFAAGLVDASPAEPGRVRTWWPR